MANRILMPEEQANASEFLAEIAKRLKELDGVSPYEFFRDAGAAAFATSSDADGLPAASMS